MRLIFMGSPEAALPTLQALLDSSHQIVAVVTQPDRPAGRGQHQQPCPVAALAGKEGLPLHQPERAKDANFVKTFQGFKADLAIIVAYGQILPRAILEAPKQGCWNVHFSLLPKYRGAAPVASALLNGEAQTGVSLMQLVEKLDAGPVFKQITETIRQNDTTGSLEKRLADQGAKLCLTALAELETHSLIAVEQDDSQATYAPLLQKSDGAIDWSQPATNIARRVRALRPWPGTYTFLPGSGGRVDKVLLKIYSAEAVETEGNDAPGTVIAADSERGIKIACGTGTLRIQELQLAGKKRCSTADFLRGHSLTTGTQLL